jgi:O-antigen/teichoic acid export membrane protein
MALSSGVLSAFLNIPAELVLAAAIGIPYGMALPLLLGEFQGEQRFVAFSLLLVGQAGAKVVGAIALGLVFGPLGVIGGISLATIAIYLVALRLLQRRLSIKPNLPWWRPAARYLAVVLPSSLSLAVLLSADVLLVKHFFPTRAAGEYAAVAAVGRAIFWGATGVATVLFPKVVFRTTQGRSGLPLVSASLVLVAIGGIAALTLLWATSGWLLTAFAGGAYRGGAVYLPWYALGMAMLGGVAVLVATYQSRGRPGFLALLLPLTILEPVLVLIIHDSLIHVVQVVDAAMGVILVSLGALYLAQSRAGIDAPAVSDNGPTAMLAEAGINR